MVVVVKYEPPVSGKPCDKAIIQSDGKVWRWIGGGCVLPLVIREALRSIEEGSPRLVRIAPSAEPQPEAGTVNYSMNCHGACPAKIADPDIRVAHQLPKVRRSSVKPSDTG